MMKRKFILIPLILLYCMSCFIAGVSWSASLQDSQAGFRNITRTVDVTTDISGTTDQVVVADDGDGTITLSTPQDIAITSSVTFSSVLSTGDITVQETGPEYVLHNTTEEDSDGGRESAIRYKGEQSGGELTTLALIRASHDGAADDENAKLEFLVNDGNDGDTPTLRTTWNADGSFNHGDGGTTNYIKMAADGFVKLFGAARASVDHEFEPSNLKLPAANFPGTATIGVTPVFQFNASSDEEVFGAFELEHSYVDGSDLHAHFHWAPTDGNAGNVTWGLEWHVTTPNNNEVLTEATTTQIIVDATESLQDEVLLTGDIVVSGSGLTSEQTFHFRIFRDADASEGGASDTYAADASLVHFDIEIMVNGFGKDEQW